MCIIVGTIRTPYHEQVNEELSLEEPYSASASEFPSPSNEPALTFAPSRNVIDRVTYQQNVWKKQVLEQRKNIYDKHIMLN